MHQQEFFARFDIELPERINFAQKSMPVSKNDALTVDWPEEDKKAYVWIAPNALENLSMYEGADNFSCGTLRVLLVYQQLNRTIRDRIIKHDWNELPEGEIEDFVAQIYRTVVNIVNGICEFCRDEMSVFTMHLIEPYSGIGFFGESNAQWSWDGNTWNTLNGPRHSTTPITTVSYMNMVDNPTWQQIGQHITRGESTELTRNLLSRARLYEHEGDYRLAVLETVIALERESKLAVRAYLVACGIPEKLVPLDRFKVKNLLEHWIPEIRPGLDPQLLESAKKANSIRNDIMHEAQRELGEEVKEDLKNTIRLVYVLCKHRLSQNQMSDGAQS